MVRLQWLVQPLQVMGLAVCVEGLQFFVGEDLALLQRQILGGQCRAEGAHQTGDGGAGDVAAQLLLKGPEHCVVVEGAALHHDVLTQLVGGGHTHAPCRWRS